MLNQSCTFFEGKKKTPCNNSNNFQYNALSSEISHFPGDNNVQFFFSFFVCDRFGFSCEGFFLLFPQLIYMGLLLLLYIARSFCYFVRPLQIVRPALPTVDDADLLPIFN